MKILNMISVYFRIHQRLHGDSELETVWVAQHGLHLYLSLDSPEPCVNYRYITYIETDNGDQDNNEDRSLS